MPTGHQIAMALRGAYLAMHRRADALLAPSGVTADQFVLLSLLADKDGVTQQQLVRRASSDPNTVRAMLLLLERESLVSRRPHPTDGRARCVYITAKGRRLYDRLCATCEPFRQQLQALFSADDANALIARLNEVAALARSPSSNARPPSANAKSPAALATRAASTGAE